LVQPTLFSFWFVYWPIEHNTQAYCCVCVWYWPTPQILQFVNPTTSAYLPFPHTLQDVLANSFWCFPFAQLSHPIEVTLTPYEQLLQL
jgi:hypothetical protein